MPPVKPFRPVINYGHPISQGLVFDTLFWEGGGLNLFDIAHGKVGAINNAGGNAWVKGPIGPGQSFDKSTGQILFTSNPTLNQNNWTIEAWFTPTLPQTTGFIYFNGSDSAGWGMGVGATSDGSGSLLIGLNGGLSWIDPSYTITNGVLTQGIVTNKAGAWNFWVNGVGPKSGGSSTPNTPAANLSAIGVETNGFRKYQGNIYGVRVWNRPLLPNEIFSLYANPWQIYTRRNYQPFFSPTAAVAVNAGFFSFFRP